MTRDDRDRVCGCPVWYVYLLRPRGPRGWHGHLIRAYAVPMAYPRKWRAKYLGTIPAPTRRMAEVLAAVVGWKRDHGRLPRVTA